MHINEYYDYYCYYYSYENPNFNNNIWNRIIKYNPYKEDIIYHTYVVYFNKREKLLSKLCNHCYEEIEPFLERKSNKPKLIKDKKK